MRLPIWGASAAPIQLPGVIRQIGYVVRDVDQAIESWLSLGVGPWYLLREHRQRATYRGDPCEVTITLAFANSGDLQIELIQQTSDAPSIFTEFLASGPGGFNQFAWWAADFDAALKTVHDAGYSVVWSGGDETSARFAYFEPPADTAPIIEISELTEASAGMAELVRSAAAGWDGSDPVRYL